MTDNFKLISEFIEGKTQKGDFYFLQILKRRKDNPKMDIDMVPINFYYVKDHHHLMRLKPHIIADCTAHNARAYFNLNKRNEKKIALQTLRIIADSISSEIYDVKNAYHGACGKFSSDDDKKWIIDVDGDFNNTTIINHPIYDLVKKLQQQATNEPLNLLVPTKNGIHIITRPFNLQEFRKHYPNTDIHKDNPTILYCL
jgi:hypothetical protein